MRLVLVKRRMSCIACCKDQSFVNESGSDLEEILLSSLPIEVEIEHVSTEAHWLPRDPIVFLTSVPICLAVELQNKTLPSRVSKCNIVSALKLLTVKFKVERMQVNLVSN
jgi:hypothetical protein